LLLALPNFEKPCNSAKVQIQLHYSGSKRLGGSMNTNRDENSNKTQIRNSTAEFLIFSHQSGGDDIEIRVQGGTVWLTQKRIAYLFRTSADNVGLHLKNIYNVYTYHIGNAFGLGWQAGGGVPPLGLPLFDQSGFRYNPHFHVVGQISPPPRAHICFGEIRIQNRPWTPPAWTPPR
jgi:hypothetical protein